MTDWTARIDALLAEEPHQPNYDAPSHYWHDVAAWNGRRLALAAERLREPHTWQCIFDQCFHRRCTCGKDADLARILEGK